ncbi:hypothetical protein PPTG_06024 [Phytophthora nicotianae INRA-310]|uniref:RXLR phytopathogen effector protein WY-domain domain-containing protein n=2 Tax=Phytophthora nicotianae TaxID=4792 RepID=W2QUZ0_PHYN3|nr:hypothetical protein PPTG_06024 [Phytophthora nicotianae INRA-310]ETN16933.1 hypothetical protein PPTG_06024 [Phytophthora nicotianae INRA-310]
MGRSRITFNSFVSPQRLCGSPLTSQFSYGQPRPLKLQRKASQVEILSATMHMNWLLLLVSIVLISGEAAATDVLRKEEQSKLLHANTVVKTTRVLTSDEEARDINTGFSTDDEEKTNVKGLSKLADLDKATWKLRKMDMKLSNKVWIRGGKDPDDMLKYFRLGLAGAKIDENKKVIQWFRFVKDYRNAKGQHWFPDYTIYEVLATKTRASESKLAELFAALTHIPDVKNLAGIMQNYQFRLWVSRKETPTTVAAKFGIPFRAPVGTERDSRIDILDAFTKVFNAVDSK